MKTIKELDLVMLCKPGKGEEQLVYKVEGIMEGRVLVTCINTRMLIQPIELLMVSDVYVIQHAQLQFKYQN